MDYKVEEKNNNNIFLKILKETRPDLGILIKLIDDGNVNISVLINILYMLNKINNGSGYGEVVIELQDNKVMFIRGEEKIKVIEPIIKTNS